MKRLTKDDRFSIYKEAQERWGIDSQINVAIEEFAELICELSKRYRIYNGSTKSEIVNEIADSWVMLEHLTLIYGEDEVKDKLNEKALRLRGWLDNKINVWDEKDEV